MLTQILVEQELDTHVTNGINIQKEWLNTDWFSPFKIEDE
jgi:hypothetical protein